MNNYADIVFYYCATRMHSTVYAVVRCLSVRLSVTLVHYVETTELIVNHDKQRTGLLPMDSSLRAPNVEHHYGIL